LKNLLDFHGYQQKLLKVAAALVKPGGCLTYSTCTINALLV
jgi:16S rRNA C967 or C1407 C5-methylase (RsmB/RsmF family)